MAIAGIGTLETENLPARFVDEEKLYLPPVRTVSLNTEVTDDDHLLQDCLVQLHHITPSVAQKWIEEFVSDIRETILETGQMDLGTIGRIILIDGKLSFEACVAGVDTPSLYGLDSFHMPKLPEEARRKTIKSQDTHFTIRIKRTTVSRVAAAAAILLVVFSLLVPNYGNFNIDKKYAKVALTETIESIFAPQPTQIQEVEKIAKPIAVTTAQVKEQKREQTQPDTQTTEAKPETIVEAEKTEVEAEVKKVETKAEAKPTEIKTEAKTDTKAEAKTEAKTETKAEVKQPEVQTETKANGYCIIMASAITHEGAQWLIKKLAKEGIAGAIEITDGKMTRVVLSGFHNEQAARARLEVVRATDPMYSGSWIKKY